MPVTNIPINIFKVHTFLLKDSTQNLQKSLKIKMLQAELILLMKLYYSLNLGIAVGS